MLPSRQKRKENCIGMGVLGCRKLYWEGLMPVPDVVPGNGEAGILFRYPHLSLTEQPPLLGLPSSGSATSSHRASSHNGGRVCVCTNV